MQDMRIAFSAIDGDPRANEGIPATGRLVNVSIEGNVAGFLFEVRSDVPLDYEIQPYREVSEFSESLDTGHEAWMIDDALGCILNIADGEYHGLDALKGRIRRKAPERYSGKKVEYTLKWAWEVTGAWGLPNSEHPRRPNGDIVEWYA